MHRVTHVGILIPARDEEELLPFCLDSVNRSIAELPFGITYDVIIAVDSSTDRTWKIATERIKGIGAVIETNVGMVGKARALATEKALQRYSGSASLCWLANTDADCVVPRHWLSDQISLAAQGIDAIAGTIDVTDFHEHQSIVRQRFRDTYLIAPDGSHSHVHGANLGVRADVYLQAGGWRDLETREDHDLWTRITQLNARTLAVSHTRVITSGRRIGRAPDGFAAALVAHNDKVA